MPDPFERNDDGVSTPRERPFSARLFKVQPRLVPMALAWASPVLLLVVAGATHYMTGLRLDGESEPATAWRIGMIIVALAPWSLVFVLPVAQRRHLTNPEPFYGYCRAATVVIGVVYPVLWISGWMAGPGDAMGRSAVIFLAMLMFGTAAALYPWAARLNHAAWLQARR